MNLLAIDTSSRVTVLGLQQGDDIHDRTSDAVNSHSREILPAIESLLGDVGIAPAELDGIVFGQGPGSFTGLRIAVGVVQGLCYGLDIPAVPVSSMACLAQAVAREDNQEGNQTRVFVGLTARLEEIYFGSYRFESGIALESAPEGVLDVKDLPDAERDCHWIGVGNAWQLQEKIEAALSVQFDAITEKTTPDVRDLLMLGRHHLAAGHQVDALEASPVYLREEVASRPAQK